MPFEKKFMIIKTVSYQVSKKIKRGIIRIGSLQYYKETEDRIRQDHLEGIPDKVISEKPGTVISAEEFNKVSDSVGGLFKMKHPLGLVFVVSAEIESNTKLVSFINSNNKYRYNNETGKLILKGQMNENEYINLIQCCNTEAETKAIKILRDKSIKSTGKFLMESEFNIHVFCASKQNDESIDSNRKFGDKVFEIKNIILFSKLIADCLLVQYQSEKLKTKGDFDSISFGNSKVIYDDTKTDKDYVSKSKDGLNVYDLNAAFIKPSKYFPQKEHRFIWFPYSKKNNTVASLPFGHKYIDFYIKDLDRYIEWIK